MSMALHGKNRLLSTALPPPPNGIWPSQKTFNPFQNIPLNPSLASADPVIFHNHRCADLTPGTPTVPRDRPTVPRDFADICDNPQVGILTKRHLALSKDL